MAERDHHSIGEVLAMVQEDFPDVTISKIRFLESQGLLEPERTNSGYRKFADGDVERLRWILHQQRDHYLPLKVIKDRIQNGFAEGDPGDTGAAPAEADPVADEQPRRADPPAAAPAPEPPEPTPSPVAQETTTTPPAPTETSNPLDDGMSTVSMTAEELASASGVSAEIVEQLRSFGLIEARTIGAADLYEGEALQIARLAGKFLERGIEVRHLKMYRMSADREAGFYQQVVSPRAGHRDPNTRSKARTEVRELVQMGNDLKAALLRRALRDQLGGP